MMMALMGMTIDRNTIIRMRKLSPSTKANTMGVYTRTIP